MDFVAVVDQVITLLRQRGRVAYRTLKVQFHLDDDALEALKDELLYAQQTARDEDGRVLVWTGSAETALSPLPLSHTQASQPLPQEAPLSQTASPLVSSSPPDAERRQLTVLFCDLVDSTALSSQLDPEDLREVVRAYQEVCAKVIARFEGYIAQYLGDGLLVYFGYPLAHEDDAQRAVRAGLGIVEALDQLNTRLTQERGVHLAVRLGIHTGLVVVGEVGGGTRQEQLALGETPNVAARLQGIAAPNTVVISAATFQLLGGFFACQPFGTPLLKGQAQPLAVYRVLYESMARSRLEAVGATGWTPLVGREQEIGLLQERWEHVKDGMGQVVLLSGEAGIGKSRLVQVLTDQVATEPQAWLTPCQCSPYHQHSALYPLIDLLERVALRFDREESPQQKLRKLEGFLVQYGLPLTEAVPLFAALLSLPLGNDYTPLTVSPAQQKQQTLHALLTVMVRIAAQQPTLFVMEDLHWVDPTTLEFLTMLVDQGPTARILALFTFRPDFSPPWMGRAHLTQVTLSRLPHHQATEMTRRVAHGKALPAEVVAQVVAKTDGVPLFVEELTKMVLESGLLREGQERYELTGPLPPLAIPATLHDSLMARLDRLATVKGLAQLGAVLGREFSYDLLQAVAPWDAGTLQQGLQQLVEAEFLYQRGLPPQAMYLFKHALIQDAAYQSLLRSTRQQYHQRIAQVLEARFLEVCETQPELLAHHYTEAGLIAQAIPYWQRAGQRALAHSANVEAIGHLTKGLTLLEALPDTPARAHQELLLLTTLGPALMAIQGYASPEAGHTYARARALCQQVEETPQLARVFYGLWVFYHARAEHQTARELVAQLLTLAHRVQDPALLLVAHCGLAQTVYCLGELAHARTLFEQGLAFYNPSQHRALAPLYGTDPTVTGLSWLAWDLWLLGYPDQAEQKMRAALVLAHELGHSLTRASALCWAVLLPMFRRDAQATHAQAKAAMEFSTAQGLPFRVAQCMINHGWALAALGNAEEGLAQLRQGLEAWRATGAAISWPYWLNLLADTYAKMARAGEGLAVLAEALACVDNTGERYAEAELHRLHGELLLQQTPPDALQAERCFRRALAIARRQEAKSWELRAATSLSRLWQQHNKQAEARALLAPIYGWFTEGFDTADLQDAKVLLEELGTSRSTRRGRTDSEECRPSC